MILVLTCESATSIILHAGEKYSLLRANCQNLVNDLIRQIELIEPHYPRLEHNTPRKTLGNKILRNAPFTPRSLNIGSPSPWSEPPQKWTERLRIREWHKKDKSRFNSWQDQDFETVWQNNQMEIRRAYSAAMKQRKRDADERAKIRDWQLQLAQRDQEKRARYFQR